MTGSSVLFDAPGPRARRLSLIFSIVAALLILAAGVWVIMTLAAPRTSGGINLPGMFDGSRWNIFTDPAVWGFIAEGIVATLQAAAVAAVGAIALGILLSLLRSSLIPWVRVPTAWVIEFFRGMPVLLMMLFILLVASTGAFWAVVIALTKNTSVAGGFFVFELFAATRELANANGDAVIAILLGAATLYLVITVPLGILAGQLERKWVVQR